MDFSALDSHPPSSLRLTSIGASSPESSPKHSRQAARGNSSGGIGATTGMASSPALRGGAPLPFDPTTSPASPTRGGHQLAGSASSFASTSSVPASTSVNNASSPHHANGSHLVHAVLPARWVGAPDQSSPPRRLASATGLPLSADPHDGEPSSSSPAQMSTTSAEARLRQKYFVTDTVVGKGAYGTVVKGALISAGAKALRGSAAGSPSGGGGLLGAMSGGDASELPVGGRTWLDSQLNDQDARAAGPSPRSNRDLTSSPCGGGGDAPDRCASPVQQPSNASAALIKVPRAQPGEVAIKRINKSKLTSRTVAALIGEAETLQMLQHSYIVRLMDVFHDDRSMFIVMELVSGGDLGKMLRRFGGRFPESTTQRIALHLLQALDYIHMRGIVHRDLKLANCLVSFVDYRPAPAAVAAALAQLAAANGAASPAPSRGVPLSSPSGGRLSGNINGLGHAGSSSSAASPTHSSRRGPQNQIPLVAALSSPRDAVAGGWDPSLVAAGSHNNSGCGGGIGPMMLSSPSGSAAAAALVGDPIIGVKIADFGFAVMVGNDPCLTKYCGTTSYMAPEIIRGNMAQPTTTAPPPEVIAYGKPVDMWALGVMIFAMLSGDMPFKQPDTGEGGAASPPGSPNFRGGAASPARGGGGNAFGGSAASQNGLSIQQQILTGRHRDMTGPVWETLSPGALDFVARLLVVDPARRMTASESLSHYWIREALDHSEQDAKLRHQLHQAEDARDSAIASPPLPQWNGTSSPQADAPAGGPLERSPGLTTSSRGPGASTTSSHATSIASSARSPISTSFDVPLRADVVTPGSGEHRPPQALSMPAAAGGGSSASLVASPRSILVAQRGGRWGSAVTSADSSQSNLLSRGGRKGSATDHIRRRWRVAMAAVVAAHRLIIVRKWCTLRRRFGGGIGLSTPWWQTTTLDAAPPTTVGPDDGSGVDAAPGALDVAVPYGRSYPPLLGGGRGRSYPPLCPTLMSAAARGLATPQPALPPEPPAMLFSVPFFIRGVYEPLSPRAVTAPPTTPPPTMTTTTVVGNAHRPSIVLAALPKAAFHQAPRAQSAFLDLVEACASCDVLDLSHCGLDDADVLHKLGRVVGAHASLTAVNLDGNPIPTLAGRALGRLARGCVRLRVLSVANTGLPADIVGQIQQGLKENDFKRRQLQQQQPSTTTAPGGGAPPTPTPGGGATSSPGGVPDATIGGSLPMPLSVGGGGAAASGGGGGGEVVGAGSPPHYATGAVGRHRSLTSFPSTPGVSHHAGFVAPPPSTLTPTPPPTTLLRSATSPEPLAAGSRNASTLFTNSGGSSGVSQRPNPSGCGAPPYGYGGTPTSAAAMGPSQSAPSFGGAASTTSGAASPPGGDRRKPRSSSHVSGPNSSSLPPLGAGSSSPPQGQGANRAASKGMA